MNLIAGGMPSLVPVNSKGLQNGVATIMSHLPGHEMKLPGTTYNFQTAERQERKEAGEQQQAEASQLPTSAQSSSGLSNTDEEWYRANGIPLPKSNSGGAVNQDMINAQREAMTFNAKQIERANALAKQNAKEQRDWEERLASSAHQREMEDLKKAGLNPILTAMGGTGSMTPAGAMATTHSAHSEARNTYDYEKAKAEIHKQHTSASKDISGIALATLGLIAGLLL